MTAMNIAAQRDRIVLITDGASYDDNGTLLAICNKVGLMPSYPGFIMQSGGSAWTPAIISMAGFIANDTDELFEKIEWILPQVLEKFSGLSSSPMDRVLFGGWSTSQNCMRLGCVFTAEAAARRTQSNVGSGEAVEPDAFTLHEFKGDQLLMQPPFPDRIWVEGWGGRVSDLNQIKDVEEFASFVIAAQRTVGVPHRGVGGFGQITTITKTELTTKVFERYDDEIGEVMMPLTFDWKARRTERSSVIPEGLSRLQRERFEKKARKGTLRAV